MPRILIGCFALLIASWSSAEGALITSAGFEEHWVKTNNYTLEGRTDFDNLNQRHWFVSLDGIDQGATASAAGSTAIGRSNYGQIDAGTVRLTRSWEFSRAAGAPFGNLVHMLNSYRFIPTEDLAFSISGVFENSAGNTWLGVALTERPSQSDLNISAVLFDTRQALDHGGLLDSTLNTSGWSPTGILRRGRVYDFITNSGTWTHPNGDEGATAHGSAQLTLTRLNAVPEPASLTLFGLGALGLAAGRKRLRRPNS